MRKQKGGLFGFKEKTCGEVFLARQNEISQVAKQFFSLQDQVPGHLVDKVQKAEKKVVKKANE